MNFYGSKELSTCEQTMRVSVISRVFARMSENGHNTVNIEDDIPAKPENRQLRSGGKRLGGFEDLTKEKRVMWNCQF